MPVWGVDAGPVCEGELAIGGDAGPVCEGEAKAAVRGRLGVGYRLFQGRTWSGHGSQRGTVPLQAQCTCDGAMPHLGHRQVARTGGESGIGCIMA